MGQGLRLISIKQNDVAGPGLLAPDLETQSNAVDFVRVLPPFQRVSRAAPAEPPFCLSRVLRREREIRMPVWRSISAHNRGNVQLVRFSTGSRSKALATARARSPLSADGPGARVERNASTPPSANHCRQWRTELAVTPNASAILGLLQPANVRRMARPLSASPRSSEPASSERADFCSSVALNGDRLLIVTTQSESRMATSLPMCDRSRNLLRADYTTRQRFTRDLWPSCGGSVPSEESPVSQFRHTGRCSTHPSPNRRRQELQYPRFDVEAAI